ncbi:MAG: ArsR family transcriptional regulator [Promethearchaeota archaeon]|nr:MAG: ArsR family transcriptional regulator [Candidatus Lokiarchaeota archaeon]
MESDEVRKIIAENIESLTNLLWAVSQENRLKILSLLLERDQKFHQLKERIDISKTTLANHLSILLENSLIDKIERGSYRISDDGKNLVLSIVKSFRNSQKHTLEIRKHLWDKYIPTQTKLKELTHSKLIIENPAEYVPGWISYISSVTGVLNSLNKGIDKVDVAGYTGYAFFFNVAEGITDPSSPTCIQPMEVFHKGIKIFGWKIHEYFKPLSREPTELPIDPTLLKELFKSVKKGLKRTYKPIILWGIPIPEYGIVNGYSGDKYIVSTMRSTDPKKIFGSDSNIKYDEIVSPGRLQALFFEKKVEKSLAKKKADFKAIRNALKVSRLHQKGSGFISGPKAFDEWANVLEGDIEFISYHGNSFISECIYECLYYASEFTNRLALRYSGLSQFKYIDRASKKFNKAKLKMKEYKQLFPFGFDGDLNLPKRRKGARLLRQIVPNLSEAFNVLNYAISNWE